MKTVNGLVVLGLFGFAVAAHSDEWSGTAGIYSDYDFRGVSLSAKDPALQGSIDYAHDSGFYASAWGSNIDYGSDVDGDIEIDLIAGWAGESESGLGWDAGIVWYLYPDSSSSDTESDISDYPEIYAGVSYGSFDAKQWYTNDYSGTDLDAYYTEANYSFELPADFTLALHAAYNWGDAFDGFEYMDFSVGLGYTVGNFDLLLKYTGTDLSGEDEITDDVFNTEPRVVFSISTAFPWGGDEE